jgi:peptidoglycan/xylan/chitin deacetylase (PgdA/CDA1 family)
VTGWAARLGRSVLTSPTVNGAVRALARLRGHGLVLIYHRVGPPLPTGCEIIPSVPVHVFRAQLQALGEVVHLVTLDAVLARDQRRPAEAEARRPAVAVTFDDDLPSHTEQALPLLREFGVPATFFLSGRALHHRGAYWFQHLEALLIAHGEAHVAELLGLPGAEAMRLLLACERKPDLRQRATDLGAALPPPPILERGAIAALAAAGMTIGFHTVDHQIVPDLDDDALRDALSRGRQDLAAIAGAPLRYFAYPHGKADRRSAAAVRRAGFDAAFTGAPRPLAYGNDRHCLGRWEPGAVGVDDLLVKLAVRLHRAAPPGKVAP